MGPSSSYITVLGKVEAIICEQFPVWQSVASIIQEVLGAVALLGSLMALQDDKLV